MREIITIQIGQAGNSIGEKFWEYTCNEHGIDPLGIFQGENDLQLERINVYFTETKSGRYVPRSIFTDVEQNSLNKIRNSTYGNLFHPEFMINGKTSASNNFAKGFFTEGDLNKNKYLNEKTIIPGAEMLPELTEIIRKIAEECDLVHGFQFVHSVSGGSGGGLGALLIDNIRQEYSDQIIKSYSIFPALSMSQIVVC
ncbi:unnamed protein product [Adineta steineri]|uniref:Tubulin/FtsZ GTPase domain-containing protein n=1 Tax=Adineta steineri TaxID=433720 RepID=A0A815WHI0_9BILA|nr:unnamed protein product [Adineta steineri]